MFVRFERRLNVGAHSKHTRSRRLKRPWPSLVVGILEARRVDGRPQQKLVAYVGTIRSDEVNFPAVSRRFWVRAAARLAGFSPEIRQRFADAIAAKIPRPPAEEPGLSFAQKLAAARQRLLAARTTKEPTTT